MIFFNGIKLNNAIIKFKCAKKNVSRKYWSNCSVPVELVVGCSIFQKVSQINTNYKWLATVARLHCLP